ncbi:aminopeptidase [Parasporobacterium paucivorans]|uniref:Leucyl aminopeptidase (Aminopeptidase T) n=1 Tax=Parasporobacterium paucivorans DSM 15970 TaxID=1122934 RepID=A0A1M6CRS1_9FIRM|nr:aminopeptidase [Parasporobacterium paucivorans]SHI63722.1 Leucyl aminopeptidase (aminopeptidase T) [Parasporobacterium paucivorans DSM 15970]
MDANILKLAKILVNYSIACKEGEKVLIQYTGNSTSDLARQLVREVYAAGGIPFTKFVDPRIERELLLNCSEGQLNIMAETDAQLMSRMDAYIGVRGSDNISELSDVPATRMALYEKLYSTPVHGKIRVPNTKWVVLRYPNASMAQLANTSLESFEEYYFKVCNLDYSKMAKAMVPLTELLNRTDQVRITGRGTDLSFSIKGIPAVPCAGEMNIPDGEVYTAPVRNSANGIITYNTPSVFQGFVYENVTLTFENGKIVNATANDTERITKVFDTDEGARYVGEFAIGVNPYILTPMKDTLFDEKIMGSIHFTPGSCYNDASNGNNSNIHWDLVLIQTPEYGGGEIYFDNVLIRKDGRFVHPELLCLNPEELK